VQHLRIRGAILALTVVSTFFVVSVALATLGFTGPYELQNWSAAGPGTTTITPSSGTASSAAFGYALTGSSVHSPQSWTFSVPAVADGTASFNWQYSGYHAYFQAVAGLQAFADGPSGRTIVTLRASQPSSGGFSAGGLTSIAVHGGYSFGVIASGSNNDQDLQLNGTITVAVDDTYTTVQNMPLVRDVAQGVLANDTDADGIPLTAAIVANPAHGTLMLNMDGSFTYIPTLNYHGPDSFTYKANDGTVDSNVATVNLTVIPLFTDLMITKTDGVTTATAGGSVTYTITASNAGPDTANGATVADTFPASLTATWTCAGAAGGTCIPSGSGNINDTVNLPAGGSVTYTVSATVSPAASGTLSNTATVTPPFDVTDPNPANNSATDTDTILALADLSITKTDGVISMMPGGGVTYTITASNAGPSNVAGAMVNDMLPPGLIGASWTCVGASGGICTASGISNVNDIVNLPVGGSVTYTVVAYVDPTATGSIANTAIVMAPGGVIDPNPGNNSATDTDTLTPTADLAITKTDGVTAVTAGGPVTYTIIATNPGPSDVTGAVVQDTFPAPLAGVVWTCVGQGGALCSIGGGGNINDTVNLPVGGSVTYTATANVASNATGTLANTATVVAPGGVADPNPANNSATDTDTIQAFADLAVTKTDGQTSATPGNTVTYTITVSNVGPSDVTGATVADTFPAALTGVTWTCTGAGGGTCTASGGGNIADTVNLPSGGSVTYTASATIVPTATGTLTNTAMVAAPNGVTDPNPANNSATDSDTLSSNVPTAANDAYTTAEEATLTVPAPGVLGNDTTPSSTLTAQLVTGPGHGTLTLNADGSFVYAPATNFNGNDTFVYRANNGTYDSNTATVTLTVTPVNDAPTAIDHTYGTRKNTALTVPAPGLLQGATDVENDPLTAQIMGQPTNGTLATQPSGAFVYTPNAGFAGADSFTYRVSDGQATSATRTVAIQVGDSARLTLKTDGQGTASAAPAGPDYALGTVVTLTQQANTGSGAIFIGWQVDNQPAGWAASLTLTMDRDHTVTALYAVPPVFTDVDPNSAAAGPIRELAARGIIRGSGPGLYGPADTLNRAQAAALIARAMGWDLENWGNPFSDQGSVDENLWRNVGTLAHYGVAKGYGDGSYHPLETVSHAQFVSLLTRAMVMKGYWAQQPDDAGRFPTAGNSGHRQDLITYQHYVGSFPDLTEGSDAAAWFGPASRGWTARALWAGLDQYLRIDRVP
jgi:uncharacterized repeat protein (TIGR01451 family)